MFRIGAAAATGNEITPLVDEVLAKIKASVGGETPDLGMLFITNHFESSIQGAVERIINHSGVKTMIGCTSEGVVGPGKEYEREPAISLWMACLPEIRVRSFHISQDQLEEAETESDWKGLLQNRGEENSSIILLGDPFTLQIDLLLSGVNQHLPGCPVIGGMASGAYMPGRTVLVLNDELYQEGCVGVSISGPIVIETVISQGCRPVGQPYLITKGSRNIIEELAGKPALLALNELYTSLSESERQLMDQGIFLGRVIDEYRTDFKRGDFLIRNVIGADQESGALAVMDQVCIGTTVQFHVRDAATADEDLRHLLDPYSKDSPTGALLFSCNGRGTRMYPDPDHDLKILLENLGKPPVAGFFCAGELGPVGGQNFIHGQTASIALFRSTEK